MNLKEEKGFTLVEILMVMIILGILTQISYGLLIDIRKRAYDAVAIADGKNLMTAVANSFALLDDVDYTHFPGGHKYVSFADMMAKRPERVIELAVKRMLPKNKLGTVMLKKLKVYRGPEHEHQAQKPEKIELF